MKMTLRFMICICLMISIVFTCLTVVPEGRELYSVDYCGSRDAFLNAEDSYMAGETVELQFLMMTDTDYEMTVDGERIYMTYSEELNDMVYRFVMPDHDIRIRFRSENSMAAKVVPEGVDTEGKLLLDYYTAPEAIVGESIYQEMTVNLGSDGNLYLNVYSGSRTYGTTDSHTACPFAEDRLAEIMEFIEENDLEHWNDGDYFGITGLITVVKFRNAEDELIRVSSEHMPDNGKRIMTEIASMMN